MSNYIVVNGIRIASDFEPETFGRLTTIGPRFLLPRKHDKIRKDAHQVCQCECGTCKVVATRSLKEGGTTSCGCRQMDKNTERLTKHGDYGSLEYQSWNGAKNRCCNKQNKGYPRYGGRGIQMCDRWLDPENGYANFLADMGRRPSTKHSLDRIDVNGDYCPENCRWATITEQNRNTRAVRNLTYKGKTQCCTAWAEEYGISVAALYGRLEAGWDIEKALTYPVRQMRKRC